MSNRADSARLADLSEHELERLSDAEIGERLILQIAGTRLDQIGRAHVSYPAGRLGFPLNELLSYPNKDAQSRASADDFLAKVREVDLEIDDEPLTWGYEKAVRLAARRQFARAGAVYRALMAHQPRKGSAKLLRDFIAATKRQAAKARQAKYEKAQRFRVGALKLANEIVSGIEAGTFGKATPNQEGLARYVHEQMKADVSEFDRSKETVRGWLRGSEPVKRLKRLRDGGSS